MKHPTLALLATALFLSTKAPTAHAVTKYWDINGTTAGGTSDGSGLGNGNWDAATANWNTDAAGGAGTISGWTANTDDAVFSAGTNVLDATVTPAGNIVANSVLIEEGMISFNSGTVDTGAGTFTVGTGAGTTAHLKINANARLNAAGKVLLNGGRMTNTNPVNGGSFLSPTKALEISAAGGTIGYDDGACTAGSAPVVSQCANIYGPTTGAVLGTGGTTANGGVGTLTIDGPNEVRFQNAGMANNTYAKLLVNQGLFRLGNVAGQNFETVFGAVPLAPLPDAITLNGGRIGASVNITLHANRGVTIGPNGGSFDAGGGQNEYSVGAGVITVPGPLSGSGTLTVRGISNSGNRTGGVTLSNANNVNTFTGNVVVQGSSLALNESLTTPNFSGDHTLTVKAPGTSPTTPTGAVSIAAGKTFTVGSDGASTSYDGLISGAGTFTKVGGGTFTMNTFTGAEWTNTGGVTINGGTIRYGTSAAGFATNNVVTVNNGATLDMNNVNDTFGGLSSLAGNTTGTVTQGTGNLTLGAASGTNTYLGTITSAGGSLTKSGASTQNLNGNNTLGAINVSAGSLFLNGTNTTGAVTVGPTGTLGGAGSVSGAITASGTLAPGIAGVGTLSAGGVTMAANSHLAIQLSGATADRLAVTGDLNLSAMDNFLDITGTGSGSLVIATYTGMLTGTFENVTSGFMIDYGTGTNSMITLNLPVVVLNGDYNADAIVDAADYVVWRNAGPTDTLPNDPTPGTVDASDYTTWAANFGRTPASGSALSATAAVPEPASIVLLMPAAFIALLRRTQ